MTCHSTHGSRSVRRVAGLAVACLLVAAGGIAAAAPPATDAAPAAVTTSAPGADTTQPAEEGDAAALAELEAAANAEGALSCMIIAADPIVQRVAEAFEAQHPEIDTTCEPVSSGPQTERLTQELQAGALSVDVAINTDLLYQRSLADEGLLVDWNELPGAATAQEQFVEGFWEDHSPAVVAGATIFGYNTETVAEDEVPTSWEDLLDPRWENRIVTVDVTAGYGMVHQYYNLVESQGEEYFAALGAQGIEVFATSTEAAQLVSSGAKDITMVATGYAAKVQQETGAPFGTFTLDPASVYGMHAMAFLEAPHPAAARLFANWLLTEEGQCALACGEAFIPALPIDGDAQELPEGYLMQDPELVNGEAERITALFEENFR